MPRPAARSSSDTDPVREFFVGLAQPGHLATFARESATVRFDVAGEAGTGPKASTEQWHLTVRDGDVTVTRQNRSADAIVRIQRPYLEAIVTGRLNAQAAVLRGLISCEGDMAALMMFQRCLPGPVGSTGRAAPVSSETVMAQRRAT